MMSVLLKVAQATKKPTAVIIKGNPKYIKGNPQADRYYKEIKNYLEDKGYKVTLDPGEPFTSPKRADLWIGHSRGTDRLRFAPSGTKTLMFGAPHRDAINHPVEDKKWERFIKGGDKWEPDNKDPSREHYIFTINQKRAINDISRRIKKV